MSTETNIILPKEKVKADSHSPKKLLIYSKPKVGKTTLFAELPDSLILDFERGATFLDARQIEIDSLSKLKLVGEEIKKQGFPYKYGIIDTVTKLEDMCQGLALSMYKKTPLGKNFEGDNVLSLPNGAGYLYLREAVEKTLAYIEPLFERLIIAGHLKTKVMEKAGKEVNAMDLDLTGKIKSMISANADAIGYLHRSKENVNTLSFVTTDDIICGARPKHLRNKSIIISEEIGDEIKVYWDKIYID